MPACRFIFDPGYDFNRTLPFLRKVHGFVLNKPSRIRKHLIAAGVAVKKDFERPTAATDDDLKAVHSPSVIRGLSEARAIAAAAELAPLGLLPSFVARRLVVLPQLRACGGTQLALRYAATGDWVFNLSGGFHHARPDLSHGFCLVNDVSWAVHCLAQSPRVLVLDLDLHQGDGNAAAFAGRDDVFTASLHQSDAFPFPKLQSDLDVALPGHGTDDDTYLAAVDEMLAAIDARFQPEVVVYVAGTDPFAGDALGGFDVTRDGLRERDARVAQFCRRHNAGLVALPAGGYSSAAPALSAAGFAAMAALASG